MFSIFSYIMSRVTHSEPGLPIVWPLTQVSKDKLKTMLMLNFGRATKSVMVLLKKAYTVSEFHTVYCKVTRRK